MRIRPISSLILIFSLSANAQQPVTPAPPPAPPSVIVLSEAKATAWLTGSGIPARTVSEAQLPFALDGAALAVLPLQEVRRADTVDALKAYVARGGRIIATYWGPPGVKTPVAAPLSALLNISVSGWSGKGNNYMVAVGAGKPLFNGAGRLQFGRGFTIVATLAPGASNGGTARVPQAGGSAAKPDVKPPAVPGLPPKPGETPVVPKPANAASQPPVLAPPPAAPFVAARWMKQDGSTLRTRDTAVVQSPSTLWIAENAFADANDSPEVRRWFANAAITMAPALRLPAKQSVLTSAQTRLDAARAAISLARTQGVDAPFNDAQTSLDAATAALANAGREMDFTSVLKALDVFDDAIIDATAQSTPSRTVEARAVWIEQPGLTKSLGDIRRLVTRLADAHFNVILPEIVYWGKAAFPSSVYPQDPRLVGFDPLRALIDEAHKRGMEVHPWVWTLCAGYYGEQGPLLRANPEWAARDKAGRTMTEGNNLFWLSPSVPAARTTIRNVIREIAARYDVDGIQLDYIRYDSAYFDYSDDARAAYKTATGLDPLTISSISPEYAKWDLWREAQVNSLVRDIHDDLAAIKPGAKLSAAVFPTPEIARRERLQDWAFWLKNRWIDWVAPMTYTRDIAELNRWLITDTAAAQDTAILVAGIGSSLQPDPDALAAQIAASRAAPAQGVALFAASTLTDDMLRSLRLGAFRNVAVVPWKNPKQAVSTLAASASALFNGLAAPDAAAAARDAAAAITTWASGRLDQMAAAVPPTTGPALTDARYTEPRALLEDARRIAAASLATPPDPGLQPSPPPIVTVANPLPLPTLKVPLITANITVDGRLDEPAWQNATVAQLERTSEGAHARIGAVARVMRDATMLYIGFTCPEPNMPAIKATVTGRDGPVYNDDSVEVFLAPDEYGLPYYHFVVGASGGIWDDRTGDSAWNGRWTSGVSKDTASWTAELAIPFSSMNAAPAGVWRANLTRTRTPDGPTYINWSVPYGSYHTPDRFGAFQF